MYRGEEMDNKRSQLSPAKLALLEQRLRGERSGSKDHQRITRRLQTDEPCPLSFAQQRLWFVDQFEPGTPSYNTPTALKLNGALNIPALERTLNEIIRRHEVLRTSFIIRAGQPLQVIEPALPLPLALEDLSHIPLSERLAHAKELAQQEAQAPFDLSVSPQLRVRLLRLAEDEHVLLFTMHHIVSDGWSMGLLVREVTVLYEAYLAGKSSPLAELPIQYADYAVWQREWLQGAVLEEQLEYWREQLGGELPVLELPVDHARPAVQSNEGAWQALWLPGELSEQLRRLSRAEGVTLFMTLLGAFQVLLSRYSGQQEIVVGTSIANRNQKETEDLIGFFVNSLVLRTDLGGDPNFREVMKRVKEVSLGAYAHQDIPFEKLVEELKPERTLSQTPLFQAAFVLQNASQETFQIPELKFAPIEIETQTVKYDLTMTIEEGGSDLYATLAYRKELFEEETIRQFLHHFQNLLDSIIVAPDAPISTLPLISDDERQLILDRAAASRSAFSSDFCLPQLFEQQVERAPNSVAVIFGDEQITYAELNRRANQVAHYLRSLGVGPETLVGICIPRSVEMVVGLLGIVKAGGAFVPLDPTYPVERLGLMIEDAGVTVLLAMEEQFDELPSFWGKSVALDTDRDLIAGQPEDNPSHELVADNLIYVMYTSGSTGRPKGVSVPHRGVVRLVKQDTFAQITPDDVFLQLAPISFDASTFELWGSLLNGAKLLVMPPQPPSLEEIGLALTKHGVSILWLTAGLFHQMVDERLEDLVRVRQVLSGGDVLSPPHVEKFLKASNGQGVLINGYGPTENTTFTCCHRMEQLGLPGENIPIGRPIANTDVYVLDDRLQPVGIGMPGQLCTGGDGLARDYLNQPELTAEKFIPHPFDPRPGQRLYLTGDVVRSMPDGLIKFEGRRDGQVKLHGFRIELVEIENALLKHQAVSAVIVLMREDEPGNKRLVAYIILAQDRVPAISEWRALLKEQLPEYMIPYAFVMLEEFPLTPNGKVDRRALPKPDAVRPELESALVAPRTPTEELLAGIWMQMLGLEQLGIQDDFFELGGHSLVATQLISRVRETFKVGLPLRVVFEQPTIEQLAVVIEAEMHAGRNIEVPSIERIPRESELPVSFAQQRLWFLQELEPGSTFYNVPFALRLIGTFNVAAFEKTLSEIVRRHEVLRTTFASSGGRPVQIINDAEPVKLSVSDLTHLSADEREVEVQQLAIREKLTPFDLRLGPLFRATLLRLSDEEHILLWTMHHIISDGWSLSVLTKEVVALYGAYSRNEESPLEELKLQYADYAAWQREWLQGEVLQQHLDYWKKQLAGVLTVLDLPLDHPRPAIQSFRGATQSMTINETLAVELKALCRREGVTLYMLLLSAFNVLLARYTQQEDILVGTIIANRTRVEVESLLGMFINMLVMRTDLTGNPSFTELLHQVREITLGAYAHQEIPFEKLVEEIEPERSLSHSPLVQVTFGLQNTPFEALKLPGLTLQPVPFENESVRFDLTVWMEEGVNGLTGAWTYNTDLFEQTSIVQMQRHFVVLLESIVAQPDAKLKSLEILTEMERERQVLNKQERIRKSHEKFLNAKPKSVKFIKTEDQTAKALN